MMKTYFFYSSRFGFVLGVLILFVACILGSRANAASIAVNAVNIVRGSDYSVERSGCAMQPLRGAVGTLLTNGGFDGRDCGLNVPVAFISPGTINLAGPFPQVVKIGETVLNERALIAVSYGYGYDVKALENLWMTVSLHVTLPNGTTIPLMFIGTVTEYAGGAPANGDPDMISACSDPDQTIYPQCVFDRPLDFGLVFTPQGENSFSVDGKVFTVTVPPLQFFNLDVIDINLWIKPAELNIAKPGSGNGGVTGNPPGIDCGADCGQSYVKDIGATLTADPDDHSSFRTWAVGPCAGQSSVCGLTAGAADQTVAAYFRGAALAAGGDRTVASSSDGKVWDWGYHYYFIGINGPIYSYSTTPVPVTNLSGVIAVAVGFRYFALKNDGSVWTWIHSPFVHDDATPVGGLSSVIAVAAGSGHVAALKSDGSVRAWGSNQYGQLGDGTTTDRDNPVRVSSLSRVVALAAGNNYTLALKDDGTVWAWGDNRLGQLGDGTPILGDGTTIKRLTPVPVAGLSGVIAIAAGSAHTIALRGDGSVWAWGHNGYGQLGDGTTIARHTPIPVTGLSGIVAITAGVSHTLALKSDGTVWAWGAMLSDSFLLNGSPVMITESHFPVQVAGLSDVIALTAGNDHALALKNDGTVWAWGNNGYGQLGDNSTTDSPVPVQVVGVGNTGVLNLYADFPLTVTKTGNGSGTVGGGGYYAAGATVTLTATPAAGSTFAGWSPSPCAASFAMPAGALTCTATFNAIPPTSAQGTAGLFDPATSTFYLRNSHSAGVADLSYRYGPAGRNWIPLVGDWDGNGTATAGLFDPATSTFYLRNSHSAGVADIGYRYGPAGKNWIPLAGDWDGDGTDTVGLFDPATSTFYLRNSHAPGAADLSYRYGPAGRNWIPLVGDWDGNGTATAGLFDPTTSTFYLKNSHAGGAADLVFGFGPANAGWTPLVGDWDGNGSATVGLFSPGTSTFYLKNSHAGGAADLVFGFGPANAGWKPLAGDWNGPSQ